MKLKLNLRSIVFSTIIGAGIGYTGGAAVVLILWALMGLAVGCFCVSKKAALVNGAVYGFALSYVFMVAGYRGADSLTSKLLPFIVFGIVGAFCGALLATVGLIAAKRLTGSDKI